MRMEFVKIRTYICVMVVFSAFVASDRYSRLEKKLHIMEQKVYYDATTFREDITDIFERLDNLSEKTNDISEVPHFEKAKSDTKYETKELDKALLVLKRAVHEEKRHIRKIIKKAQEEFSEKYLQTLNLTETVRTDFVNKLENVSSNFEIMQIQMTKSIKEISALSSVSSNIQDEVEHMKTLQNSATDKAEQVFGEVTELKSVCSNIDEVEHMRTLQTSATDKVEQVFGEVNELKSVCSNIQDEVEHMKTLQNSATDKAEKVLREVNELNKKYELLLRKVDCHRDFGYNFGNSCYYVEQDVVLTWAQANAKCKSEGGYLAEIDSEYENSFLVKLASKLIPKDQRYGVWIGGSDLNYEGVWVWKTSQKLFDNTYSNFKGNLPDGRTRENCLHLIQKYSWNWNDFPCEKLLSYICEKRL